MGGLHLPRLNFLRVLGFDANPRILGWGSVSSFFRQVSDPFLGAVGWFPEIEPNTRCSSGMREKTKLICCLYSKRYPHSWSFRYYIIPKHHILKGRATHFAPFLQLGGLLAANYSHRVHNQCGIFNRHLLVRGADLKGTKNGWYIYIHNPPMTESVQKLSSTRNIPLKVESSNSEGEHGRSENRHICRE